MKIFQFFSDKIAAKYTPKRTKLHHFKKKSVKHAPNGENPLTNVWPSHAQHGVLRHAYIPTFEN